MEAELIKEDQVHVALDTGVFWEVLHKNAPWLEDFKEMAKSGVVFSFADHAMAEIIKQLEEKRFTEAEYVDAITECKSFISPDVPLLPGKKRLGQWCQAEPVLVELEDHMRYLRACWTLMTSAKTLREFEDGIEYELRDGTKTRAGLSTGSAAKELEKERNRWRARLEIVPANWRTKEISERLEILSNDLDSEIDCTPGLTVRLDAALRNEDQIVELRSLEKTPYNPHSISKENDGIDFNMSYVFMKRILLCTLDGKYRKKIEALNSFQSHWIFSPETFVDAWKARTLLRVIWPGAIVFDTNAYRVLVHGKDLAESRKIGRSLCEKEIAIGSRAYAHPIVAWELFGHLADPSDPGFNDCLNALVCLGEHTALPDGKGGIRVIADSYHASSRNMFGRLPTPYQRALESLSTVVAHVVKYAPDLSATKCQHNLTVLHDTMDAIEEDWLTRMETVVDQLLPGMAKSVLGGTLDKTSFAKVRQYLESPQFFDIWSLGFTIDRAASVGVIPSQEELREAVKFVRKSFETPFRLMQTLILKMACVTPVDLKNARKKRWNFVWDSIISFSIGPGNVEGQPLYLVTGDGEITDAAKEAGFGSQVVTLANYLALIGHS